MAAKSNTGDQEALAPGGEQRSNATRASGVRFTDVTKTFPGMTLPAVDHVSMDVHPGDLVVLLGPSGCGKTTLLKLVNRLYEPTAGSIAIDGKPNDALPAPELRRRIGYVIQQSGLFPHMRVADNVAVVPRLLGWARPRINDRVDELLDLVGLPPEEYRRRYPAQLSGGEQQRVGLARALAADPPLLLMDEPFGALDAITRTRLQDELARIHAQLGQTVLFVTHDVEEAVRLADRIAIMRDGRLVQYDRPADVVLRPADAFVGELIGSGDVLRRLSLIPVSEAIQPANGAPLADRPAVSLSGDLRAALGLLLESGVPEVAVVDDQGATVGMVNLDAIHERSAPLRAGTAE